MSSFTCQIFLLPREKPWRKTFRKDRDRKELRRAERVQLNTVVDAPRSSKPPSRCILSPAIVMDIPLTAIGRLAAKYQCRVTVSITSTVHNLPPPSSVFPPATTKRWLLHATAGSNLFIRIGGKCCDHLLPRTRLKRTFVGSLWDLSPPTVVTSELT